MFLTCPLPTQYLLLFVPSHKKKEKRTTGFFPFLLYQWLQSTQECTFSQQLLCTLFWPGYFMATRSDNPTGTNLQRLLHSTLSLLVFIWVWSKMGKGQGSVCKLVRACHDKNIIHDSMIWEREKKEKKSMENKVIWWRGKVSWFSWTGYLHRQAYREPYQPVKVFSLGVAAAGRKLGI